MSLTPEEILALCAKFSALHDQRMTQSEIAALGDELRENRAVRRLYIRYSRICAGLSWGFSHRADAAALPAPVRSAPPLAPSSVTPPARPDSETALLQSLLLGETPDPLTGEADRRSGGFGAGFMTLFRPPMVFLTMLMVALCSVVGTYWLVHPGDPAGRFARNSQSFASNHSGSRVPNGMAAAYLTAANGCSWQGTAPHLQVVGSSVQVGEEIHLHEGIAEFCLTSGAMLSLEGPATLVMLAPNSIALEQGKLTAYIPSSASEFVLITPTSRLISSAVEFGVNVSRGIVDTHVFSGDVLVQPLPSASWDDGVASSSAIVREEDLAPGATFITEAVINESRGLELIELGNSVQVSRWHAADKRGFNAKLAMSGGLLIDQGYVNAVKASKPLGYWRFENQEHGQIANEIKSGMPLNVMGELRLADSGANHVADFGRPGSRGFLLGQDPIKFAPDDDYSVEVWLKPNFVQQSGPVCMLSDLAEDKSHAFMLQLTGDTRLSPRHPGFVAHGHQGYARIKKHPGSVRVLHRDPVHEATSPSVSCVSNETYAIRRWQHFVVVKQGADLRIYVDTELVAKAKTPGMFGGPIHLLVGQQSPKQRFNPFIGQLDELALYNRALSDEEIIHHFRAVKWTNSGTPQPVKEI